MEFHGKLYGRLGGNTYFFTGKTTEDFDSLEKRVFELEEQNKTLQIQIENAKFPDRNWFIDVINDVVDNSQTLGADNIADGILDKWEIEKKDK